MRVTHLRVTNVTTLHIADVHGSEAESSLVMVMQLLVPINVTRACLDYSSVCVNPVEFYISGCYLRILNEPLVCN